MPEMKTRTLDEFVTDRRLIAGLCRKRIDLARKNRRGGFISRAAGITQDVQTQELVGLLPPRQHWPRLLRRERATEQDLPAAKAKRLEEFVVKALAEPEPRQWAKRLRTFLDECRSRILGWSATAKIQPDRYVGIPKGRPGTGMKYRVVAPYALRDAIADSAFASYLRSLVDARLDTHSYAFRLARAGGPVTHHDAVADLREFTGRQRGPRLWVAECDIRGFFDSVSHDVTRRELVGMLAEGGSEADSRLHQFMETFFAGYDYREARHLATKQLATRGVKRPNLYDPVKALKEALLPVHSGARVGIPQGSSFSSVLANVVLASADRAVRKAIGSHRSTFYARYVDDILLVSTNQQVATKAIRAYRRALRTLELPDHPPVSLTFDQGGPGRSYWAAKSKAPYTWCLSGQPGVEWIGFLGYQIKRDGTIRVRRSSVQKELAKQRRAIDDILGAIDERRQRAHRSGMKHAIPAIGRVRYAAMMHLTSIGIGYPSQPMVWPAPNGVCWASGFRLLRGDKRDISLLRALDRGRGVALRALTARLSSMMQLPGVEELKERSGTSPFVIRRDGFP